MYQPGSILYIYPKNAKSKGVLRVVVEQHQKSAMLSGRFKEFYELVVEDTLTSEIENYDSLHHGWVLADDYIGAMRSILRSFDQLAKDINLI